MAVDVRVDPLDKIRMDDGTRDKLLRTIIYATQPGYPERMRSFFNQFSRSLEWGKGEDGRSPTMVVISPDFTEHSYGFAITTFRFDEEKQAIVQNHPFFLMLYYRQEDDRWEMHS